MAAGISIDAKVVVDTPITDANRRCLGIVATKAIGVTELGNKAATSPVAARMMRMNEA